MALPGVKQICYICSEEVTDADYRRELTCSYGACPGTEHAYHEECMNKYLRKLRLPVDQLIGYQCPVTLDNGKPCSGRITSTHHRQPLNQKKKQKRVEAAAAAAAAPKPKAPVPKAKEAKPGVAAATAAMRPVGEGALRQDAMAVSNIKSVASALPTVKSVVKVVAPGSGPAARLNGTALAVSNNSAMTPERVVRQRIIPGWTGPEVTKASALPQVDRAKLDALKAEAKAGAGRSSKTQVTNTAAASAQGSKEGGGTRARQSSPQLDPDGQSEDSDTHPFLRYAREDVFLDQDAGAGDDDITPPEEPQDFHLAQEDFPAFPLSAASSAKAIGSVAPAAVASAAGAASPAKRHAELEPGSSGGCSVDDSPTASTSGETTAVIDAAAPASPAAPADGDESDPIVGYDQLYSAEGGLVVVQDVHGNCYNMEDVYGQSPEVIGFDDGTGAIIYYVVVRGSTLLKAQQEMAAAGGSGQEDAGTSAGMVPEPAVQPTVPATLVNDIQMSAVQYDIPDEVAVGGGGFISAANELPVEVVGQTTVALDGAVRDGADELGADLDDLLALCMVTAPAPGPKPSLPASQSSYTYGGAAPAHLPQQGMHGNVAFGNMAYSTGYIADAPADTADEAQAADVDSLMQLLCV